MIGNQSIKRQRRGAAARILLSLHKADQLARCELWTWDMLDALPNWCIQDEDARVELQLICGALVLAPELRLWIDRKHILAAYDLCGKKRFDCIIAKADQNPITVNAAASTRFKFVKNQAVLKDSVKSVFLQAGASVLKATLTNDLLNDMFAELLGENAGDVTEKLACNIVTQAEEMLQESVLSATPTNRRVAGTLSVNEEMPA